MELLGDANVTRLDDSQLAVLSRYAGNAKTSPLVANVLMFITDQDAARKAAPLCRKVFSRPENAAALDLTIESWSKLGFHSEAERLLAVKNAQRP